MPAAEHRLALIKLLQLLFERPHQHQLAQHFFSFSLIDHASSNQAAQLATCRYYFGTASLSRRSIALGAKLRPLLAIQCAPTQNVANYFRDQYFDLSGSI